MSDFLQDGEDGGTVYNVKYHSLSMTPALFDEDK